MVFTNLNIFSNNFVLLDVFGLMVFLIALKFCIVLILGNKLNFSPVVLLLNKQD